MRLFKTLLHTRFQSCLAEKIQGWTVIAPVKEMQESKTFGSAIKKNEWTNKVNPLLACFFFEFASASFTY